MLRCYILKTSHPVISAFCLFKQPCWYSLAFVRKSHAIQNFAVNGFVSPYFQFMMYNVVFLSYWNIICITNSLTAMHFYFCVRVICVYTERHKTVCHNQFRNLALWKFRLCHRYLENISRILKTFTQTPSSLTLL